MRFTVGDHPHLRRKKVGFILDTFPISVHLDSTVDNQSGVSVDAASRGLVGLRSLHHVVAPITHPSKDSLTISNGRFLVFIHISVLF